MDYAYGDGNHHSFFQLPFVRLFYAAEAMVAVFFVVSGYVLSHRCVRHARSGDYGVCFRILSSLALRRVFRLFLPAIAASFLAYLAQRAG